jgi:hypothetical protein
VNTRRLLTVFASIGIPMLSFCNLQTLAGQTPSANRQKATTRASGMMPMPLVAPLFIEDEERTGVVTMVNSASQGLDVDVVLYTLSGDQIATRAINLTPYSQQTVAIADLLQGSNVRYGSVFIVPHRLTTMAAQLSIAGRNGESTNDIEEEFQMLMGTNPANFKTVTVSKNPVVAVRSLSPEQQTLSIACLAGEAANNGQISIGPNQTLLIDACAEGGARTVPVLGAHSRNLSRNQKAVAVSLSSPVASQDLAVFGFGLTGAGRNSGFVAIPLTDGNGLQSSTAVFPGATTAAANSTKLHAAIANFGAAPHQAIVTLSSGGGYAAPKTIATVQLAPHSVTLADLSGALSGAQSEASFMIQTDGAPGEVLSGIQALGRADGSPSQVALPWKDRGQAVNGGQHPWRIDGGFSSTLSLYNPDPETANSIEVIAHAGDIAWKKNVAVPPQATITMRLNDIIEKQEPDDSGTMLPRDSTTGMITWFTLADPRIFGQLVQADAIGHIVRPFACAEYYQVCGVTATNVTVGVGMTNDANASPKVCGTNGDCVCIENCDPGGSANFRDWSSSDTTIATLSSSSGGRGTFLGKKGGSTYSNVTPYDSNCVGQSGGGTITVNPGPDHVKLLVDNLGFPSACPTTGIYVRQMKMQVVDVNGTAVTNIYSIAESYQSLTTNTCGNGQPVATSCRVEDSGGQFLDTMSVSDNLCNSGISQSSGCGYSLTSIWAVCSNGLTNTLWTSPRITHSNSDSVNGSTSQYAVGTEFH